MHFDLKWNFNLDVVETQVLMHIALIFNVMAYFVLSAITGYQAWKAHEVVSQIIVFNMIFTALWRKHSCILGS